jgi:5-methylthioadenosine/S-adenosylhomocysteine deaminase
VLGPRLIAVHAVHLDDAELDLLAQHGASVAHCPSSNLKLASGIARVASMLKRGINIGLGTDGAASNNRLDAFQEMRQAALLAKGASGDAEAMPAHAALAAATIGAARAMGLDGAIGSIVPGKAADLTAVRFDPVDLAPCYDPASHLVYAAGREHVSHVWVAGKILLEERRFCRPESAGLEKLALLWHNKLVAESIS